MPNRSVSDPHELVELAFEEHGEEVISKTSPEIGDSQESKEDFTKVFPSTGECQSSSGQEQICSEPSSNCGGSDSVSHGAELRAELILDERKTSSEKFESGSPGSERLPKEVHSISEELDPGSPGSYHIPNKLQSNSEESGPGSPGSDRFPKEVHSDSEDSGLGSPGSASTRLNLHSGSMMQSPPVQVMERPDETSTYRIPSHVFARSKSGTPAEWSVASNESLFSLHVGNNSFSRDHIFMMGRSGELGKYGDMISSSTPFSSPPSPVPVFESEMKCMAVEGGLGVEEAAETMNVVLKAAADDRNKAKVLPVDETPKSCSHLSDGSRDTMQSFSFPILIEDGGGSGSVKVGPEQDQPRYKVHSQSIRPSRTACYPMWCTACYPIPMWRSWLPRCRLRPCWRV